MASRWMFARCLFSVERRLLHVADCTLPVQVAGAVSCIDASQALWERLTSGAGIGEALSNLLPRDQGIARQPRVDHTTVNQDTIVHGEPRAGPLYEPSPAAAAVSIAGTLGSSSSVSGACAAAARIAYTEQIANCCPSSPYSRGAAQRHMRRFIHPNRAEQRDKDRSKHAAQGEGQCVAAEAAPSRWCVTIALARNRAHSLDSRLRTKVQVSRLYY